MSTQNQQKTLEKKKTILKGLQNPYVDIMRQKIGEFMLIRDDLERRGTTSGTGLSAIIDDIDKVYNEKDNKQIAEFIITNKSSNSTDEWADHFQISLLSTLLYNNGFPCQIIVKTLKNKPQSDMLSPDDGKLGDVVYKMPVVYAGARGEPVEKQKQLIHYTFIIPTDMKINIPENLKNLLTNDMEETSVTDGMVKYQTEGDGHCFYRAVANWFIIYGITTDHLKNMTYNVPFDFSEEHFKQNLKVPNPTDANSIPEPISLPNSDDFKKIAENMKNKIQNTYFNPTFEDKFKNIKESKEYENYDGLKKDNGTHCNKYKGNKYKGNKDQEANVV